MSGWTLFFIIAVVVVAIIVPLVFWSAKLVDVFVDRCLTVLSHHSYMTPCEIAYAHAEKYGVKFGDIVVDANMITTTFPVVEQEGQVVGQDHIPDDQCGCLRAYRLSYGITKRKHSKAKPKFEWLGGLVPKPV